MSTFHFQFFIFPSPIHISPAFPPGIALWRSALPLLYLSDSWALTTINACNISINLSKYLLNWAYFTNICPYFILFGLFLGFLALNCPIFLIFALIFLDFSFILCATWYCLVRPAQYACATSKLLCATNIFHPATIFIFIYCGQGALGPLATPNTLCAH